MDLQGVDIVGVTACVLAAASLLWQCKTWRDSHRERIDVKLKWKPRRPGSPFEGAIPPSVAATVVNAGRVPLYLKEVVLERKAKDEPPPSFGPGPEHGIVRLELRSLRGQENPLNVGEGHEFVLAGEGAGFLRGFIESKHVWLAVRSERRELCRLKPKSFVPLLKRLHDAVAPGEEEQMKRLQADVARVQEALQQIQAEEESRSDEVGPSSSESPSS